jgi:hypothetical protein
LIDRADAAMYEAKQAGRDRVVARCAPFVRTTPSRKVAALAMSPAIDVA